MNERCPCGEVIYANTEDWEVPLCYECYVEKGATMKRLDESKRYFNQDLLEQVDELQKTISTLN